MRAFLFALLPCPAAAEALLLSTSFGGVNRISRIQPNGGIETLLSEEISQTIPSRISAASASANGTMFSYWRESICTGGRGVCPSPSATVVFRGTTILRDGRPPASVPGFAYFSRDERFAVNFATSFFGGSSSPGVIQLDSRAQGPVVEPAEIGGGCRIVSNTGTAIYKGAATLMAASLTEVRSIPLPAAPTGMTIADDGQSAAIALPGGLFRISLDSGRLTLLHAATQSLSSLCGTGNLDKIAFIEQNRAVLWESGRTRTLWDSPAESVTLDDSGRIALYSLAGRWWRHEIATGAAPRLMAVVSEQPSPMDPQAPGSLLRLSGTGFAPGSRAWIGDLEMPVLATSPRVLTVQIPWEAGLGNQTLTIENPSDGAAAFSAPPHTLFLREEAPQILPAALHPAFDQLVTEANPARAGQYVHLYMTGLGAVSPPVRTGQPAPSSPLAELAAPLRCGIGTPSHEVFWAGLAPGLVGLYQADIGIPADATTQRASIVCRTAKGATASTVLPVVGANR